MNMLRQIDDERSGYKTIAFNDRFDRLIERRGHRNYTESRAVSIEEARFLARKLRRALGPIADDAALIRVLHHNPEIVRVVDRGSDQEPAFLAYLPLNEAGIAALTSGNLDRRDPDIKLLCRADESAEALYLWCLYSPGNFIPAIAAIAAHFQQIAPGGVPLFTSPASNHAARLFASLGFDTARAHFPDAAEDLLVVFRAKPDIVKAPLPTPMLRTTTRVTSTIDDIMKVFAIRAATYMSEQHCPYEEEFDGNDFCGAHILGEIDGEPAGCIRIRFFGDFVKLERLAVRPEFRTSTLAFRLVRAAIDYCRMKGFNRVYGHARHDLVSFWERFGFKVMPGRPKFAFSDVDYVEMDGPIAPDARKIAIGHFSPLEIIRPEGRWDKPGPLDRSAQRGSSGAPTTRRAAQR